MVDGGVAIATGRLAAHLVRRGHHVTVLTQPPPAGLTLDAMAPKQVDRLRVIYQDIQDPLTQPEAVAELSRHLQDKSQSGPFDVLLAYFVYPSGYLATRLGEELDVPVVCSCRGNDISKEMFIDPQTLSWVLDQSTHLLFVSASLLDMAHTLTPCRHKATVVDNSVDGEAFRVLRNPGLRGHEPVRLGTSGVMRWKKGLDLLLPLVRELAQTHEIEFHIAGYGLDDQVDHQIASFVHELDLAPCVRLLGPLPHHRMAESLNAMDIYVTASYQEGMPNGVLEAMACALPVVATAVDAVPRLVQDGRTGYLCPPGDLQGLTQRCRELIEQPELRRRLGAAGRERVLQAFRPEHEADAIEAVLVSAATRRAI